MILSLCDLPETLEVMRIINIVILIIKIAVPIMLILSVSKDAVSVVVKGESKSVKKLVINRIIAALLIFLVPTFVSLIAKIAFSNSEYKNCLGSITVEKIANAYESQMEVLLYRAEITLDINDYNEAYNYLINIKNENKRNEYILRLNKIKELIEKGNNSSNTNNTNNTSDNQSNNSESNYSKVNYSNFKWTYYSNNKAPAKKYYSSITSYAIWSPENIEDLNGVSLPLIYFMHGYGEIVEKFSGQYFTKNGSFTRVLNNWSSYNLDPIPAIIIAPHAPNDFKFKKNVNTMRALIQYAKDTYNIDTSRIVLMGHSMGADDTVIIPYENQKYDVFSAYVLFSPSTALDKAPYSNGKGVKEYFKDKKIRAYSENTSGISFFKLIDKKDYYMKFKNGDHSKTPRMALIKDSNKDGVSDLMYWLFGEDAVINKK